MSGKIVVIGSSNVDFIMKMDHLPRVGESVPNAEFMQTFGGKGANQAVAVARAGGSVDFIGCVGDDAFGTQVIANLKQAGVGVAFTFVEAGVASGAALVMIGAAGQNYLSVAPGANHRLSRDHLDRARACIAQADLVLFQYEILPDVLAYGVELAHALGKTIMLNLAPAQPIARDVLRRVNILVVNEVEAEFLCGFSVAPGESAQRAARFLQTLGPEVVIITLGAAGAELAAADQQHTLPGFVVPAVDTTAAGDVFCGALAVALAEGQALPAAARFANAAAALAVTRLGAQPSIPTRREIDSFLASFQ